MRRFIFAVFAAFFASSALAEEVCTLQRIAVVPFETDETGHIFVPVTIGGRSTRLMVDTGGFWSLMRDDLAQALNLRVQTSHDVWMVDLAGEKLDKYVTIPELKLGSVLFNFPLDFILQRGAARRPFDEYGGTLGLNVFARWDLEIDNAGKTISLFKQDHCKGAGVHWADEAVTLPFKREKRDIPTGSRIRTPKDYGAINMPIVAAEVGGEVLRTILDTGATVTSLDIDHAKRRFGIGPGSPGVERAGIAHLPSGTTVDLYSYTFKTLTISGIRFENVTVHLGKFDESDLILGMNELKHLHLYFAFKDGLIHVTAANAGR